MICKADTFNAAEKKIRMLLAGYPGIGKTTLGLSAPKPLHIDVDCGIDRIEPRHRSDYIQPKTYDEILTDLTPENTAPYETLVFDTGGKLINLIGLWAIKQNPKNQKRDGSLSLQGYGLVGREFQRLMDYCFYELNKHIVLLFHAIEDKDNDSVRLRIKCEGSTKNAVWEVLDLGGFMEMYGNNRTIGFSNCERYFAKGTRGISGVLPVPTLGPNTPNDFLTRLFEQYNAKAAEETKRASAQKEIYDKAMEAARTLILTVTDAESATAAMPLLKGIQHALTSEREVGLMWNAHIKSLGLFFDKILKAYTPAPSEGQQ